jgi:hypothetical protein
MQERIVNELEEDYTRSRAERGAYALFREL